MTNKCIEVLHGYSLNFGTLDDKAIVNILTQNFDLANFISFKDNEIFGEEEYKNRLLAYTRSIPEVTVQKIDKGVRGTIEREVVQPTPQAPAPPAPFVGKITPQAAQQPASSQAQVTKPTGTLNVYWFGQNKNKPEDAEERILSNLAPRPFPWQGKEYGSVEHAYQTNKSGKFDQKTYDKYVKAGGYGTKIIGPAADTKTNLQLMKDLVVESFIQNPDSKAAKVLLKYETFTHNTNEIIDQAFLEGLKLAQTALLSKQTQTPTQQPAPIQQQGQSKPAEQAQNKPLSGRKLTLKDNGILNFDGFELETDLTK